MNPLSPTDTAAHSASPAFWFLAVLTLLCLFSLRMLLMRRRNRVSILLPVALVAAGIVLFSEESPEEQQVTVRKEEEQRLPSVLPDPEQAETDPSSSLSVRIENTDQGRLLVMPLPTDLLEEYLGPEAVAALQNLNSVVPDELLQAYFMVPLPAAAGESVPALAGLAAAVGRLASMHPTGITADVAAAVRDGLTSELPHDSAPEWFSERDRRPDVVTSGFETSREQAESRLREEIAEALLAHAWTQTVPDASSKDRRAARRKFRLTHVAADACIRERFADEVIVPAGGEKIRMHRITALLEFPDSLKQQALRHVRRFTRNERVWTLGAAAMSLSLLTMLAAAVIQVSRSPRRLVRYVGVPLLSLLLIPDAAVSTMLLRAMASGRHAPVPSPFELPDTHIDYQPTAAPDTDTQPAADLCSPNFRSLTGPAGRIDGPGLSMVGHVDCSAAAGSRSI